MDPSRWLVIFLLTKEILPYDRGAYTQIVRMITRHDLGAMPMVTCAGKLRVWRVGTVRASSGRSRIPFSLGMISRIRVTLVAVTGAPFLYLLIYVIKKKMGK